MEMEYTCAWALHKMSAVCDKSDLWFSESERKAFGEMLGRRTNIFVRSFISNVIGSGPKPK